ncbi:hypothetical protein QUF64_07340 [Anaerolineales bacterium HSG6]|nr:hypothetical protein [Anaerolineales bacterium HSG6]MDM8531693.1 hypothetical protein [Anaerolineales bacterium HSG25]
MPQPKTVIFIIFLISMLLIACTSEAPEPPSYDPISLTLTAPETIMAGDHVRLTVIATSSADTVNRLEGQAVRLTMLGSFGLRFLSAPLEQGQANFDLLTGLTQQAGWVTLIAQFETDLSLGQTTVNMEILPNEASGPLLTAIGPKTVPADGVSQAMLVALPQDQFGNPVQADSSLGIIYFQPPQGQPQTIRLTHSHRLVWAHITSTHQIGLNLAGVTVDQSHSSEQSFMTVPHQPAPFELSAPQSTYPIHGKQLLEITSSLIRDSHGNLVLDGSYLQFLVTDHQGTQRHIPAHTIDGRGRVSLQTPPEPGLVTVQALMQGRLSQPLVITFTAPPATKTIPLQVEKTSDSLRFTAGPILGTLQQLLADGQPIQFVLDGEVLIVPQRFSVAAKNGEAILELRQVNLEPGTYRLTVSSGGEQGQLSFVWTDDQQILLGL